MNKTLKATFILLSVVLVIVTVITFFGDDIRKYFGHRAPPLPGNTEVLYPKRMHSFGENSADSTTA